MSRTEHDTPPDLYTPSDAVRLEGQLKRLGESIEKGISGIRLDVAAISKRMTDINDALVARSQRTSTIATIATVIGSCGFVVAVVALVVP